MSLTLFYFKWPLIHLVFSFTISVGDSADKPPAYSDPSHHVRLLWSHAACRKPTKRHCVQLWTCKNQRHGETYTFIIDEQF